MKKLLGLLLFAVAFCATAFGCEPPRLHSPPVSDQGQILAFAVISPGAVPAVQFALAVREAIRPDLRIISPLVNHEALCTADCAGTERFLPQISRVRRSLAGAMPPGRRAIAIGLARAPPS
jgi:hypothetical protein